MREFNKVELFGEDIAVEDVFSRSKIRDHIMLIGDSYAVPNDSYFNKIREVRPNVITSAIGGSGFAAGTTFAMQISSLGQSVEKSIRLRVGDIYICGGYNDCFHTESEIALGITQARDAINTYFPNAKGHILMVSMDMNDGGRTNLMSVAMKNYSKYAGQNNFSYSGDCCYILRNPALMNDDGFHPNADGEKALFNSVYAYIQGSYTCDLGYQDVPIDVSSCDIAGATVNDPNIFKTHVCGSHTFVMNQQSEVFFSGNGTITDSVPFKLGTFDRSKGILGFNPNFWYNNYECKGYVFDSERNRYAATFVFNFDAAGNVSIFPEFDTYRVVNNPSSIIITTSSDMLDTMLL